MSELDIELQKQTADVSITEMMQELDNVQQELLEVEPIKIETIIGDDENG